MDSDDIFVRMMELIKPIDEAVLMCDSRDEILMLASVMLVRLRDIYDTQLGTDGRKIMFGDFAK